MIRKITLLFLLWFGVQGMLYAQTLDTVTISLPPGMDTTCVGTTLTFTGTESIPSDTAFYYWYVNDSFVNVVTDTFSINTLNNGDSVFCEMYYFDSGILDSSRSNTIYVYHGTFPPKVSIAITAGVNPDCPGHPITFTATPVNGGDTPLYQWQVNGAAIAGEDSISYTGIFNEGDMITCVLTSNSPCASTPTAISDTITIVHLHLVMSVTIAASALPACSGKPVNFSATVVNPGAIDTFRWYVGGVIVSTSTTSNVYTSDTLSTGDLIYCGVTTGDSCILNSPAYSNIIFDTVIISSVTSVHDTMIAGINPSCLDSPATFEGTFSGFGANPSFGWYVNGVEVALDTTTFTSKFSNGDVVTFEANETDGGCYTNNILYTAPITMFRDSTPIAPLLSLIGDELVVNTVGTYQWYGPYGLIPGATGQIYHPVTKGYYYVVIDTSNCPSLPSNVLYISLLDISNLNSANLKIYPNPASSGVTLNWGSQKVNANVSLYNIMGQQFLQEQINDLSVKKIDLSKFPDGEYYIDIEYQDGTASTWRIVLAR